MNSQFASPNYSNTVVYDNEAPTKVGAMHTPSFVRIRWTDWLTGSTQAASWVSSVVNPGGDRQVLHGGITLRHDCERSHTGLNGFKDFLLRVELRKRLGTCRKSIVNVILFSMSSVWIKLTMDVGRYALSYFSPSK